MARGINKVIVLGNLGSDPEFKEFSDGKGVCSFSVATSETWKDKNTGEKMEKTEWHRISAFGRLAEICVHYLAKGNKVYIEGKLQTRKWQDKDGNDRYTTEIIASEMQMLDSKGQGGQQPQQQAQPQQRATNSYQQAQEGGVKYDDDIPF